MSITREQIKAITEDAQRLLDAIGAKHGVAFRRKTSNYGEVGKIAFDVLPIADGKLVTPEALAFSAHARLYGLDAKDLGATFIAQGQTFRIVGLNTRRGKYPIMAEQVGGARRIKLTADSAVAALAKARS